MPLVSLHPVALPAAVLWLRAILSSALIILALVLPATAIAQGLDYREPDKAPPSWTKFGKLVKYKFEEWIAADNEVANRFRAYITGHTSKEDAVPQTLVVHVWLNSDGTVERVSFSPLNDPHADADLHTILTRGNLGEAPPPDMLQPLNLCFSLNLKKDPEPQSAAHEPQSH
jgi:hypothetical protein